MRVIAYIVARDEGKNLPQVLEALEGQSLRPELVFLDDHSHDNTLEILRNHDIEIFRIKTNHPSLSGRRELGLLWNIVMRRKDPSTSNFWIQCGADVILRENYLEEITGRMIRDHVVISSGNIEGEYSSSTHIRGAGRVYKTSFWRDHIGEYPPIYGWESYPLFKAQALGFRIRSYPDLLMKGIRPTNEVKPEYGMAMSQLGYWPPYAIGRCLLGMMKKPKAGIRMLSSYLFFDGPEFDGSVSRYIESIQIHKVAGILSRPFRILRRIRRRL